MIEDNTCIKFKEIELPVDEKLSDDRLLIITRAPEG